MQQMDYYSGVTVAPPPIERVQGEVVDESQFAVNARDLYQYNYSNQPYQYQPQPYGGYQQFPPQGGYYQQPVGSGWVPNAMNPPQDQSGPWSPYFQQMKQEFHQNYYGQPYYQQPNYYQQATVRGDLPLSQQDFSNGEPEMFNLGAAMAGDPNYGFSGRVGAPFPQPQPRPFSISDYWNNTYLRRQQLHYNQKSPNYFQGYGQESGYYQGYNSYGGGQPVSFGNGVYMNPTPVDVVVKVDGFNPMGSSKGILSAEDEKTCNDLDRERMADTEKAIMQREKNAKGYFNANEAGYEQYYGPGGAARYYDFIYSTADVDQKYYNKVQEMAAIAMERKKRFMKGLSRMVHGYLQDGTADEEIDMIYDGYSYTIPAATVQNRNKMERLAAMVPVDTALPYQQHSAMVSAMFNMCTPPTGNMNESLRNMGFLKSCLRLEEEAERRKAAGSFYGEDTYRMMLRKWGREGRTRLRLEGKAPRYEIIGETMHAMHHGDMSRGDIMRELYGKEKVAELEKNGMIINDDGTLSIQPPDWFGKGESPPELPRTGNIYDDMQEATYELRREEFIKSILAS